MKRKRGNPNWGKLDLHPTFQAQPSSFEQLVRKLQLQPEQYVHSDHLKDWVRRNKDQKYVPLDLLKAWGFEAASEF
jgi:hypothetical protein